MAATPGTFSPVPLGRRSRNGLRTYYKEEYGLNAEDLVAQTSSTQSRYAVTALLSTF